MTIHRFDILAALRKAGASLASVGREAGLSRKTMWWALVKPHPRANKAIADRLGRPLHDLWPEWFDAAGVIRVSRSARAETAPSPLSKSKREAA